MLQAMERASHRRNQADPASLRRESIGRASFRGKRWNGLVLVAIWIVIVFVKGVNIVYYACDIMSPDTYENSKIDNLTYCKFIY